MKQRIWERVEQFNGFPEISFRGRPATCELKHKDINALIAEESISSLQNVQVKTFRINFKKVYMPDLCSMQ